MQRLLPAIVCVLCLLLGLSVGWYFGYTRPSAKARQDILKQNKELFTEMKRRDETATAVALRAIYILDRGEVDNATHFLVKRVGNYYRLYRDQGGTTIDNIEKAAAIYPIIATEISKKPQ